MRFAKLVTTQKVARWTWQTSARTQFRDITTASSVHGTSWVRCLPTRGWWPSATVGRRATRSSTTRRTASRSDLPTDRKARWCGTTSSSNTSFSREAKNTLENKVSTSNLFYIYSSTSWIARKQIRIEPHCDIKYQTKWQTLTTGKSRWVNQNNPETAETATTKETNYSKSS